MLFIFKSKACVIVIGFYWFVSILPTSGLYDLQLPTMDVYSFVYHKAVEIVSHSMVNHQAQAV